MRFSRGQDGVFGARVSRHGTPLCNGYSTASCLRQNCVPSPPPRPRITVHVTSNHLYVRIVVQQYYTIPLYQAIFSDSVRMECMNKPCDIGIEKNWLVDSCRQRRILFYLFPLVCLSFCPNVFMAQSPFDYGLFFFFAFLSFLLL